jgi:predicted ArsR family transcriptional regulator
LNLSPPRDVDREALVAIRQAGSAGIGDLVDSLNVTATAVRQRIERLLESGLIEREKCVAGRGRPTYQYRLTLQGQQAAGARLADLAEALWREVMSLEDPEVRERVFSGAAQRMGALFAAEAAAHQNHSSSGDESDSPLQRLSKVLSARQMVANVADSCDGQGLPVLDISVCPYPSLTTGDVDRSMCRMEEKMFSEAMGQPMHLSSCRLDGHSCCQFTASAAATPQPSNQS